MSITVVYTIVTLVVIGGAAAVILYFVAQKFKVFEDPRIDEVEGTLPGANCGGCGFAGCRAFAEACVKASELGDFVITSYSIHYTKLYDEKEGSLATKYNEQFLKILPAQKVLKLYKAENEFRMYMFRKYRDNQNQRKQENGE